MKKTKLSVLALILIYSGLVVLLKNQENSQNQISTPTRTQKNTTKPVALQGCPQTIEQQQEQKESDTSSNLLPQQWISNCKGERVKIYNTLWQERKREVLNLKNPRSNPSSPFAKKLVNGAFAADKFYIRNFPEGGNCAGAVQVALNYVGLPKFLMSGDAWFEMRKAIESSGKFVEVKFSEIRPGDILAREPNTEVKGSVYGHIAVVSVVSGDIVIETSDHTARFELNNDRYLRTKFYRYVM